MTSSGTEPFAVGGRLTDGVGFGLRPLARGVGEASSPGSNRTSPAWVPRPLRRGLRRAARSPGQRRRRHGHHQAGDPGEREGSPGPEPRNPAVADRLLDESLAERGDRNGRGGKADSDGHRQCLTRDGGGQHENRPVPEIQRVRDAPQPARRSRREQPGGSDERHVEATEEDQRRADGREQGGDPGNGVATLMTAPAPTINASPTALASTAGQRGIALSRLAARNTSAPRASSHARAGRRKNASGASTCVRRRDSTSDMRPTIATTATMAPVQRLTPANRVARSSRAGQNR